MVIDSGYSHTTITPVFQGRALQGAIRRLDVGGKLMTNHLTRLLSLRHYDMRNDTYLVNEIKEACCYASQDFKHDLDKTWKGTQGERRTSYLTGAGIAKDYVLPDYHSRAHGFARDHDPALAANKLKKLASNRSTDTISTSSTAATAAAAIEDIITLRNERFSVPEVLFTPSDIGLRQSGIPQLVLDSLASLPLGLWPAMLANILVVGGNANIEGFILRLQVEIKALAPAECIVRCARPADPVASTWLGAAALASQPHLLKDYTVSKQEYEEHGAAWVARKFHGR